MNSNYKRIQREKHINSKMRKMRSWYQWLPKDEFDRLFDPKTFRGRLSKGKIHCSCPLCKPWKYPPYEEKAKYRAREKAAKKEMEEFL